MSLNRVILSTVFGAMIAGQISSMAPNYIEAKVSAARCFNILDRVPEIDAYSPEGRRLVSVVVLNVLIVLSFLKKVNTAKSLYVEHFWVLHISFQKSL